MTRVVRFQVGESLVFRELLFAPQFDRHLPCGDLIRARARLPRYG